MAEDRKLTAEERAEQKQYQKLADFYTPLVKLFSSEYSNQLAYDGLQIHGGSGFMKDYPIERIFRDARITTIYEGTSQLQVVAAIRGVTTGGALARIQQYDQMPVKPEHEYIKKQLNVLTADYEKAVAMVTATGDSEYLDFHARRLVEMAGHIIMAHLLLQDSQRSDDYILSTEVYLKYATAQNKAHGAYIENFEAKDLGMFKMVKEEVL